MIEETTNIEKHEDDNINMLGEGSVACSRQIDESIRGALESYFNDLGTQQASEVYELVLREVEPPMLIVVLEKCGGNQSKAAQVLGLSRTTLRKKLNKYNLI